MLEVKLIKRANTEISSAQVGGGYLCRKVARAVPGMLSLKEENILFPEKGVLIFQIY
jgi:hypothetical protein